MNNLYNLFSGISPEHTRLILLSSSFLGGIVASVSPCSLAMLPVVIAYIGGYGDKNVYKTGLQLVSFVIGSSIVFSVIGLLCAITGRAFISFTGNYFILVIAAVLMLMGLNLIGILNINIPIFIKKIPQSNKHNLILYPMLLGAIFAVGGTPCSTPILLGIMSMASISNNFILSIFMLFLFALGEGVILILAGLFTSIIKNVKYIAKYSDIFIKLSGIVLILISIYFYLKIFLPFFN